MSDFMHADIFFFITSIVTVVLGVLLAWVLYYVVGIVRDLRVVMRKVRRASDELEQDFERLRASVKNEGLRVRTLFELMLGFIGRQIPKPRVKREVKEPKDSN